MIVGLVIVALVWGAVVGGGPDGPVNGPVQARGDAARSGIVAAVEIDKPRQERWSAETTDGLVSSRRHLVSIAGARHDTVVLAESRRLSVHELSTGHLLWTRGDIPFVGTGPKVGEDVVVNVTDRVVAYELGSGAVRWSVEMPDPPQGSSTSSLFPVAVDGGVVVLWTGGPAGTSIPSSGPPVDGGGLVALDLQSGEVAWPMSTAGLGRVAVERVIGTSAGHLMLGVQGLGDRTDTGFGSGVVAVRLDDGAVTWELPTDTEPSVSLDAEAGRLYVREPNRMLTVIDVADGQAVNRIRLAHLIPQLTPVTTGDGQPILIGSGAVLPNGVDGAAGFDATTGALRWQLDVPHAFVVAASPSVVHVATAGRLIAVDPASGQVLWETDVEGQLDVRVHLDGTLLLAAASGLVQAVDPDGSARWRISVIPRTVVSIRAADGQMVTVTDTNVVVHAPDDGTVQWRYISRQFSSEEFGSWITGSPVVTDETLIIEQAGTEGLELVALELATGLQRWVAPVPAGRGGAETVLAEGVLVIPSTSTRLLRFDATDGNRLDDVDLSGHPGSPAVVDGIAFLTLDATSAYRPVDIPGRDARVAAVDLRSGDTLWEQPGDFCTDVVVADGTVVAATTYGVFALDATTGQPRWTWTTDDATCLDPAVIDGVAILATAAGLHGLDLTTGERLWTAEINGGIAAAPVIAGGEVYAITPHGGVVALEHRTGRLGWVHPGVGPPATPPAVIDGELALVTVDGRTVMLSP